jgi:alkanesulfonate monooxygenase SsuD/methylene tetrahydromethanopterin reductase-like flavin-dependent oxidoreductase (luciferase family)
MNVGIYFDMRNPPEWAVDSSRLYGFTLEMCEEAEHLGCHSIWLSEHHRFDDGYLPQPLTMAAAVAARTRSPRIGTAIVVAPLHHPAELAEQAAIVDLLSAGRLELGLGAGYRVPEFELYDAELARRYQETDGRAREIRRLWDERVVTPVPHQERLPIWMGYQGPKGARRAGLLGENLLSIDPRLESPYRQGLAEGGFDEAQARMAGGVQGWATEDPEADWPVVARHLAHQVDSYRRHMVEGTDQPRPRPIDPDRLRQHDFGGVLSYFVYGTPEEVSARLRGYVGDAPIETVFFWASLSGMAEDLVARHVNTICTGLAPLLAEDNP